MQHKSCDYNNCHFHCQFQNQYSNNNNNNASNNGYTFYSNYQNAALQSSTVLSPPSSVITESVSPTIHNQSLSEMYNSINNNNNNQNNYLQSNEPTNSYLNYNKLNTTNTNYYENSNYQSNQSYYNYQYANNYYNYELDSKYGLLLDSDNNQHQQNHYNQQHLLLNQSSSTHQSVESPINDNVLTHQSDLINSSTNFDLNTLKIEPIFYETNHFDHLAVRVNNNNNNTYQSKSKYKLQKQSKKFKDLLEPLIDLTQPNVTTIMQRPVDMGETKRYKRKNYEELEKRRTYECKYYGCKKSYTKSSHLKAHARIHTGKFFNNNLN
jgi:hypothetical protein